jgi:uncharacterized protein YsxB (DUF464 family)
MLLKAHFVRRNGMLCACTVSGHDAVSEDTGFSVLCAAVSSAVQLTSALLVDCFGAAEDCITVRPADNAQNQITVRLSQPDPVHSNILKGLLLHFQALSEDFPGMFRVTVSDS